MTDFENTNQAVRTLARYAHASFSAGTHAANEAEAARQWLESRGHTVTTRYRNMTVGDGPTAMVYLDGSQVA